jgi:Protein of unknown function (DUF3592)
MQEPRAYLWSADLLDRGPGIQLKGYALMTLLKTLGLLVVLSLPVCIFLVVRKHIALTRAVQYEGRVVAHEARSSTTYALKIQYTDADNHTHRFVSTSSSYPPSRNVGDRVTVFHHVDGSSPDILVFEDLFLLYWIWISFGIAVAGCMLIPYLLEAIYLRA